MAAYLYLPRSAGAKGTRTVNAGRGVRIDFDARDVPIGVEITAPALITVSELNAVLAPLGIEGIEPEEWAPLAA